MDLVDLPQADLHRLDAWLAAHVPGFEGPVRARRFGLGQSNPTFRLETPTCAYVLRRKPSGDLLPSAHAVDREFRVISALAPTGFPVPQPLALCTDDSVIGSMFYVMSLIDGRVLCEGAMPELTREERRNRYVAMIQTLARLHRVDVQAAGLQDYGRPGNYFSRQVARWSRQYRASETTPIPAMDRLIEWLPGTAPEDADVCIVHGDFRLDNMIWSHTSPHILAVVDWELSTLGSPMADLTYFLSNWIMPERNSANGSGFAGEDLEALGIPTLEEAVGLYCDLAGRPLIRAGLDWHFAYNLFRLAAIFQGIAARVRAGNAAGADAATYEARIAPLADLAWGHARMAGAPQ